MGVHEELEIDHELLVRTAKDLRLVGEGLAAAADRVAAAGLDGDAFGRMNTWMVSPITTVASRSTELVSVSATVVDAFGTATEAAAADWDEAEQSMITAIESVGSTLDGITL